MTEVKRDLRGELDALIAALPRTLQREINSIVDDIEEQKWNKGFDAGAEAYEQ